MAPPSWAYQVDNFDPPPDEELVCSVCRGVFCDPVQSPCHHVYCRACLFKWLENNRNCPICRKRTTRSSVQEVVPLIKNMILKLTMRCRNWENNCREKFTLEACEAHAKSCAYEMIQCKYKPCLMMFLRKDIREHEFKNCPHRTVKCMNCSLKMSPSQHGHDCIEELKRKLKTQDEIIKKKEKKIKELQKEIVGLKDAQESDSDLSSLGSVSAGDILIDLEDMASDFSPFNSISDTSNLDDDSDFGTRWFDYLGEPNRVVFSSEAYDRDNEDSLEFPREPSPALLNDVSLPEPVNRRPAKRRHPAQALDTSDEDGNNNSLPSLPSPKRTWNLLRRNIRTLVQGTSQTNSDCSAGPSHTISQAALSPINYWWKSPMTDGAAGPSSRAIYNPEEPKASGHTLSAPTVTKVPKPRPMPRRQASELTSTPNPFQSGRRTSPVFERTLAMLEHYNLESDDDEWVPTNSQHIEGTSSDSEESADEENVTFDSSILKSEASSYFNSDSTNSSREASVRTDWLSRLAESVSESDPEWTPP